jgi:hypothetical protein
VSERTLKQMVGALAVLLGVWAVGSLFRGGAGTIAAPAEITGVFDGVDATSLDALRVERGVGGFELARTGDGWTVNGYPADVEGIGRLLEVFDDLTVGDLVASNPANHDRMGVSDDSAYVATLTAGGDTRTLLVGKSGRRFGTSYVRLPGRDQVYLLEGDLRAQLGRDVDSWRNRTVVAADTASITRIAVDRADGSYALVRGDSAWALEGGGEVAGTAVSGILAEWARMVASGFLAEGDSIAALERAVTTTAFDAAGNVVAELSFGTGAGDRWARNPTDAWIYRVSSFRVNRVAPPRDEVRIGG